MTTEEFIERAKKVHGDKYDYSKTVFVSWNTKVCIICHEHGEFWQDPYNHLRGKGCPKCSSNRKVTFEEFVERAGKVHGDKFVYYKSEFRNMNAKMRITCREHGDFEQCPSLLLKSYGCPECSSRRRCYGR